MKRLSLAVALITSCLFPVAVQAQTPACQFVLGFATMAAAVPQVGTCKEQQHFAPNGDAQQLTAGGLLVWRKADNWTAFTDGYRTWLNGPNGIQQRLNTDRFSWEAAVPTAPSVAPLVITQTDSGNKTYDNISLPGGLIEFQANCGPCNDNFIVELTDSKGGMAALLANDIGFSTSSTPGTVPANIAAHVDGGIYSLKVTANGSWKWQLTAMPFLTSAPTISGPLAGHGSAFLPLTLNSGQFSLNSSYNGSDNFIVEALQADGTFGTVLANRIGSGTDQKSVNVKSGGVFILNVKTTGDWTITPSQP